MNKNEKKSIVSEDKKFANIFILAVIFLMLAVGDMLYNFVNYGELATKTTLGSFVCAYGIVYCVYLIIWGLTNKSNVAISVVMILLTIINIINQVKILYMGEPVYLSDAKALTYIGEILELIDDTLLSTISKYIPIIFIIVLLVILFIIFICKKVDNLRIQGLRKRILIICIPITVLMLLFVPNKVTNKLYLNIFYGASTRVNYNTTISNRDYYLRYGVIGGMYGQFLEATMFEPNGYDEKELKDLLDNVKKQEVEEATLGKPNIIVVLSESFWDISKLDEIKFDKELTSNFNKLKQEGLSFELISPSFGGLTANVEMELLTGYNLAYYHNGYTPYLQMYDNDIKDRPSIIRELKNNGYVTRITTCTGKDFYNREEVYTNLGFDEKIYLTDEKLENYKGSFLSDEYLTDRIISELKNKKRGEKLFSMTLTIQQHMPYVYDKYNKYDISIVQSNLDKTMEQTVLAYAQGVYDADKQLGRLNEYIQTFEEPTIVVFFGDHLPYLNTANRKDVMKKLSYFNTGDELMDNYRKYNTQALVIANYEIKDEGVKYLSTDLLMPYLLNRINLNLSSYYKWLNNTIDLLPAYNKFLTIDKSGKVYKTEEISGELLEQYILRERIQYMLYNK